MHGQRDVVEPPQTALPESWPDPDEQAPEFTLALAWRDADHALRISYVDLHGRVLADVQIDARGTAQLTRMHDGGLAIMLSSGIGGSIWTVEPNAQQATQRLAWDHNVYNDAGDVIIADVAQDLRIQGAGDRANVWLGSSPRNNRAAAKLWCVDLDHGEVVRALDVSEIQTESGVISAYWGYNASFLAGRHSLAIMASRNHVDDLLPARTVESVSATAPASLVEWSRAIDRDAWPVRPLVTAPVEGGLAVVVKDDDDTLWLASNDQSALVAKDAQSWRVHQVLAEEDASVLYSADDSVAIASGGRTVWRLERLHDGLHDVDFIVEDVLALPW